MTVLPKKVTFEQGVFGLLGEMHWKSIVYDHDEYGNVLYKGCNPTLDASQSDSDWYIWKYVTEGKNLVKSEGPLVGAWTDRAELEWDYSQAAAQRSQVQDDKIQDVYSVFAHILKELQKVNLHLAFITDNLLTDREVE